MMVFILVLELFQLPTVATLTDSINFSGGTGVGIGTVPSYRLDVLSTVLQAARIGSTQTSTYLHLYNSVTGSNVNTDGLSIGVQSSNADFILNEAGSMRFYTNNSQRINVSSLGAIRFHDYGDNTFNGVGSVTTHPVFDTNGNILELTSAQLTALFDHGTLTGLSDDDHAQYALLAGRSGRANFNRWYWNY